MNDEFIYISENYKRIIHDINEVKIKSGRTDEIQLMAVTKTVSHEKVNYAISCGISLLGENRVQEYLSKREYYTKNAEIHFIGGLQNNKIKYIIDKVNMIHSVDSIKLAKEIDKHSAKHNRRMDILLEVNIGNEPTKHGFSPNEVLSSSAEIISCGNLRLRGLMTIPPITMDNDESYLYAMNELYQNIKASITDNENFDVLSMGMSNDYQSAIKHGATILRLGTALFGKR